MKIGVFGGTFDPFTVGHYEIVKKVLDDKLVDKVIVIPTIVDYYRQDKKSLFSYDDRQKIIEKWFEGNKNVILDYYEYNLAREADKLGSTGSKILKNRRYINMLDDLKDRYCYKTPTEFCTIIGGDSWNKLDTWHEWQSLFDYSSFIVVKRDEDKLADHYIEYPDQCWTCPKIEVMLDKKFTDVSATKIRNRLVDAISGMSLGPKTTCLEIYLDEVDDYLKTGKTYEDRHNEYLELQNAVNFDSLKREATQQADSAKAYDTLRNMKNCDSKSRSACNCKDQCELLAHTPIFDVFKDMEVEEGFRPVKIKSNDWVGIIVVKNGQILTVSQMRYGIGKKMVEVPCGIVEPDEMTVDAALRELAEETGYVLENKNDIKWLGSSYANPAFMTNKMNYFYVDLDNSKYHKISQHLDEHEHLEVSWMDLDKFRNMVDDVIAGYQSVFTVAAMHFYDRHLAGCAFP